ncbi:cyclin Dx isoform X2 [Synchiropus splendidus]|uniref:cyclin Dx isoform X2 n=1 Tax=Synchiropus splendidus TaxID=270530 RepID=UPI00237EC3DB|nr:cyclin Dx isoform X2 [Synchiropus splendidus]
MSVNTQFSRLSCSEEYLHCSHSQLEGLALFPSSEAVVSSLGELPSYLKRLPSSLIPQPPLSRSTNASPSRTPKSRKKDENKVHPKPNPMTATFSPPRCQSPKKSESLTDRADFRPAVPLARGISRIPYLSRSKDIKVTQSLEEQCTISDLPRSSYYAVSVPTSPQLSLTSSSQKVSVASSECIKPRKLREPSLVTSLPPHCSVESKRSPSKIPRASPSISRLSRFRLLPGESERRKTEPTKHRENSQKRRTSSASPSPSSKLWNMATFHIRREDPALSRSSLSPTAVSLPLATSGWMSDLDTPFCGNTVTAEIKSRPKRAVRSSSSKRLLGTFTKSSELLLIKLMLFKLPQMCCYLSEGNDAGDESGMLEEVSLQPQMTKSGTLSRTPGKGLLPHIRAETTSIETPSSPRMLPSPEKGAVHPRVCAFSPMVPPLISYSCLQEESQTPALSSSKSAPSSFMPAVTFPRTAPTSTLTAASSLICAPPSPGGAPLGSPPTSPRSFSTAPSSSITSPYSPAATPHRTRSPILTASVAGVAEAIDQEGQLLVPIPPTKEPLASNAPLRREGPLFGRNLRFPHGGNGSCAKDPAENMSHLYHQLRTDNWNVRLMGLKGIQTLAWHNPHYLQPELEEVCKVLADEVNNLCPLACEAIDTMASLCLHLGKAMDGTAGRMCLDVLLKLSQTTNKFILQKDVSFQELLVDPSVEGTLSREKNGFTEPVSELISSDRRAEALPLIDPVSCRVPESLDGDSGGNFLEYSAHPDPHLPVDLQRNKTAESDIVLTTTSSSDQDVATNLYVFFRHIRSDQCHGCLKSSASLKKR